MNPLERAVELFTTADLETWEGLPGARLSELEQLLVFDREDLRWGQAGDPGRTRMWVPAASETYAGGLRLWLDESGERVVLLEGLNPVDPDGELIPPPELGDPDATLEAVLGPFHVRDGERVYGSRGIALQVFPETGALVGVLGFAPTGVEDYRRLLQPRQEPTHPRPEVVM